MQKPDSTRLITQCQKIIQDETTSLDDQVLICGMALELVQNMEDPNIVCME